MKKIILSTLTMVAVSPLFAHTAPVAGNVTMTQSEADRAVTITYTLTDGPAIVTFDVLTNGVSIGGKNLRCVSPESDVWKKVSGAADTIHTIVWNPDYEPDFNRAFDLAAGGVTAVVTAWSLDNPPDYRVVDLSYGVAANSERYYPTVDHLPGGILDNCDYRISKLVLRRIHAAGVEWTMGSVFEKNRTAANEPARRVTLDDDYYIGVFPFTQAQYRLAMGGDGTRTPAFALEGPKAMRPMENISFNELRCNAVGSTAFAGGEYPAPPYAGSFLDTISKKTGLAFDLPTDEQWEYACRAGNGENRWGSGKGFSPDPNNSSKCLNIPGRYRLNGGWEDGASAAPASATCPAEHGTAIVGSYAPNLWGLYDMHGNVFEFCVSWFDSAKTTRVRRGGSYNVSTAWETRSPFRLGAAPTDRNNQWGFRVTCALPTK